MAFLRINWGRPIGRSRVRPWHIGVGGAVLMIVIIITFVAVTAAGNATISVRALDKRKAAEETPETKNTRLLTSKLGKRVEPHNPRKSPWRI
jgi:hypothetical protein